MLAAAAQSMPLAKPPFIGATRYLPPGRSLASLRTAVQSCHGCPLYRDATQAVFGEGPRDARIVMIGEVPGDREDRAGHPFVGPAGALLDEALAQAKISRDELYLTNAVKHFKYTQRGKRRIHDKPTRYEVRACKPWLDEELRLLAPDVVVLLGATAAQALLGSSFRVTLHRGELIDGHTIATVHPASVLRAPDAASREEARKEFFADIARAGALLAGMPIARRAHS